MQNPRQGAAHSEGRDRVTKSSGSGEAFPSWPSQGNKKRRGKTVTWLSKAISDLKDNDLDVRDTKTEWRNKILDLYWKDKQKGAGMLVEGT